MRRAVCLTKSPQRRLTKEDKMRIVFLRYGSLVDFSNSYSSHVKIAKKLRLAPATVSYTLLKFAEHGFRLDQLGQRYQRYRALPANVRANLLSPPVLQAWAHLTLPERCEII